MKGHKNGHVIEYSKVNVIVMLTERKMDKKLN